MHRSRSLRRTPLALLLALAAAAAAAQGPGNGANPICALAPGAVAPTAAEIARLNFMREEEKLARDVYQGLYQQWQRPLFDNIAASEQSHMDQVNCFLEAFGLPDPAPAQSGRFSDPALQALYDTLIAQGRSSLTGALQVGALIEETDIRDLDDASAVTGIAEVKMMYASLRSASGNHLRAFATNLAQEGVSYTAQVLPAERVTALLALDPTVPGRGLTLANGEQVATTASFALTLTAATVGNDGTPVTWQTPLALTAETRADPGHVGRQAQLLAVALHTPLGSREARLWQAGVNGWEPWSGRLEALAGTLQSLPATHTRTLFSGTPEGLAGYLEIYGGYLLDGVLIYGERPAAVSVLP